MQRVFAAFRQAFIRFLDQRLPRRTKRLLFLASFFARVKPEKEPSFSTPVLAKLNTLMELSNRDTALKLPVHLSHAIWRGKSLDEICGDKILDGEVTTERLEHATQSIITQMPKWLRYGRPSDIEKDVRQLLIHRAIFTTT